MIKYHFIGRNIFNYQVLSVQKPFLFSSVMFTSEKCWWVNCILIVVNVELHFIFEWLRVILFLLGTSNCGCWFLYAFFGIRNTHDFFQHCGVKLHVYIFFCTLKFHANYKLVYAYINIKVSLKSVAFDSEIILRPPFAFSVTF